MAWEALRVLAGNSDLRSFKWTLQEGPSDDIGTAAALLATGCGIKLPASSFPGFRVAPPTEFKSGEVETTSRPKQSQETPRQGDRAD